MVTHMTNNKEIFTLFLYSCQSENAVIKFTTYIMLRRTKRPLLCYMTTLPNVGTVCYTRSTHIFEAICRLASHVPSSWTYLHSFFCISFFTFWLLRVSANPLPSTIKCVYQRQPRPKETSNMKRKRCSFPSSIWTQRSHKRRYVCVISKRFFFRQICD